jgi:hypothetical protein
MRGRYLGGRRASAAARLATRLRARPVRVAIPEARCGGLGARGRGDSARPCSRAPVRRYRICVRTR